MVRLSGGTPRFISLKSASPLDESSASWKLDQDELRSLFSAKTKAIILNTPNNPIGKVFTREELTVIELSLLKCYSARFTENYHLIHSKLLTCAKNSM